MDYIIIKTLNKEDGINIQKGDTFLSTKENDINKYVLKVINTEGDLVFLRVKYNKNIRFLKDGSSHEFFKRWIICVSQEELQKKTQKVSFSESLDDFFKD